jgi:predicted O-methyltransferase YrrM
VPRLGTLPLAVSAARGPPSRGQQGTLAPTTWPSLSGARRDVEVVTVELDDEVQRTALSAPWPPWVRFESGDGAEAVGGLGQFDLIFPDAPGGKIFKPRRTVAALRRGGVLIVDDMDLTRHED